MPNYNYRCTLCGTEWEEQLLIADRNDPCEETCGFCEQKALSVERYLPTAPGVSYTAAGNTVRKKTPEAFKDILRNIKTKHLHSTIDV